MAFIDSVNLVRDVDFIGRVTVASVRTAQTVAGESADGMDPGRHAARSRLAHAVINSPTMMSERFTWSVVANPAVSAAGENGQAAVSDGDIEYVVISVWDDVAGVDVPA